MTFEDVRYFVNRRNKFVLYESFFYEVGNDAGLMARPSLRRAPIA
jgi:hypothetical protein